MMLEFNPKATATWHTLPANTYVLVIDDYLANAFEIREFALALSYDASPDFFPGWRASASLTGSGEGARKLTAMMLDRVWPSGWPEAVVIDEVWDSLTFLVTAWDDAIQTRLASRGQHADRQGWLSTIVHLGQAPDQERTRGTAFWRHRRTGLTTWIDEDPARCQMLARLLCCPFVSQLEPLVAMEPGASLSGLARQLFSNGDIDLPPTPLAENEDWELLLLIPARFNRLVCYPRWQIHSLVDLGGADARLDVRTARLTMMQFLDLPVSRSTGRSSRRDGQIATVKGLRIRA